MRTAFRLAAIGFLFVGGGAAIGGEAPGAIRQLMFKAHVYQGDPLGSVQAGTIKALSEPILVTVENRPFSLHLGDDVPISTGSGKEMIESGYSITGTPRFVKGDKLRLDLVVKNSTITENANDFVEVQSESTRTISTVKEGEVVRVRIGKPGTDTGEQLWVELTYELVKEVEAR